MGDGGRPMSDEGEFEAPYVYDCGQDHGQLFPNLVKDGLPTLHPDTPESHREGKSEISFRARDWSGCMMYRPKSERTEIKVKKK
jgi:hypothetical protein